MAALGAEKLPNLAHFHDFDEGGAGLLHLLRSDVRLLGDFEGAINLDTQVSDARPK